MSWLDRLFSFIPPPADSIKQNTNLINSRSTPTPPPNQSKTILQTATASTKSTPPQLSEAEIQEQGRRRNKIIFGAGLGFIALSILSTRRSLARRRLASQAKFFSDQPGHHEQQSKQVSGALEAVEALNIATINVLSVAMTLTGATLWYLDINSLRDARILIRGGLGVDGTGRTEEEANEEIEEVIAGILARKDEKNEKRRKEG